MAARVVLRDSASFTTKSGEAWRKNQARVIHDEGEIAYYRSNPEFTVTAVKAPARPAAEAPTPPADPGGGDPGGEGDPAQPPKPTEASLSRMTKGEIVELAATQLELVLEEGSRKDDLISAYLEAQG